ncbi:bifunctional UDP-N-acetylmuramoyl-tripeptide:D-alanyl-D-alanine ligase/alanine racemase [Sanyastnella coralliicola]|uniref:bifunctional UDP-N-acetylmuramoyl-tripeptide:D-alanyl-D-alanine ligase/alanine racemase n=1 Tax=Sanyastnella coralliicola TaxID=3069118 RepID=UPI0027BA2E66|nr:bifunctional UDP-N-acetylmuramoyl-tripeptide:D-alanyl-D-alanine ligase/alanine racemase [Longitalea sp. SCSIO 12813]
MLNLTNLLESLPNVEVVGASPEGFKHFSIDTRVLTDPKRACFIALTGPNHDGHQFIAQAYELGVRHFLVHTIEEKYMSEATFYVVPDTREALQQIAGEHRKSFSNPVIGITGSNGKTIVKEWLNHLLMDEFQIVRSPKSYNSQIGVALSLLNISPLHEMAIIEAGISMPNEMARLEEMIAPDMAVFTHLGSAHLENFVDQKALALEKAQLFKNAQTAVYCNDEEDITAALDSVGFNGQRITWGRQKGDIILSEIRQMGAGAELTIQFEGRSYVTSIVDGSEAFISNTMTALTIASRFTKEFDRVIEESSKLSTLNMRLERLDGWGGSKIISDVYSNDLPSLRIALDELSKMKASQRVVVLSDIPQSGLSQEELYAVVNEQLVSHNIDLLIAVGSSISKGAFDVKTEAYQNTDSVIASLDQLDLNDAAILLKGARTFGFERITNELQQRAHESILLVDLRNLTENLNFYRSRLDNQTQIMVMIKAFGYGTGGVEIAELLEYNRVDCLGVAYVNEAIDLRNKGIGLPIFVLNPDIASFSQMIDHRIEPEIYSMRQLTALVQELKRKGHGGNYPIHLKIDTGMHRLGFVQSEIPRLIEFLNEHKEVKIKGALSHLAAADDPTHDEFTRGQIEQFQRTAKQISEGIGYDFTRHICNTAGLMRFPEAHFEMVRLGIGLYGVSSCAEDQGKLEQVGTLKSKVSQLHHILAGESVGYTRSGVSDQPRTIATIPIGYADGYRRSLSNGAGVILVNGHRAKVVGKVCMDMVMIDVTGLQVEEGDEVTIFGSNPTLEELAAAADTIPYEIISGISQRVKRIYLS